MKKGYHPKVWKEATVIVIPNSGKLDYTKPRAYKPISLLTITSEILEKIIQVRVTALTKTLLPKEQFGGGGGHSATDAVLFLVQ